MKIALSILIFAITPTAMAALGFTERERSDSQSRLANVDAFVNRRLRQPVERRLDLRNTCNDFVGSDFMDEDLYCICDDFTDPNVVQIQCSLEAECAYAETICSSGGTVIFTMKGFKELADLMEVDISTRQKSYDLEIMMSSCTEYTSPDIGEFCFVLPMTNTVYLTTENLDESLKTGKSCEITLDGKDCFCEMDREDEYTGDGEEPCFKTDCSTVDDSISTSICKVVVDSQNELQTSFLLPFSQVEEPDNDKAHEHKSAETPDKSNDSLSNDDASASSVAVAGVRYTLVILGVTALVTT